MPLREMAEIAQVHSPQIFKHHLNKLVQKGFVSYDKREKSVIYNNKKGYLTSIPIYGSVTAGPAVNYAEDLIEGYLKISPKILGTKKKESVFALRVSGDSMNKEIMNGLPIDDNNYVLVEKTSRIDDNDIVVSIFENTANIKKIKNEGGYILLKSNSRSHTKYPPIVVTEHEKMHIIGKVWYNIKN